MKKPLLLAALATLCQAAALAQAFTTYPGDPVGLKKAVLDNGFTVFVIEDHTKPVVFGAVAVKAGGKNDPKDATGMAHYLEHMLFKGTRELGTTDFDKERAHLSRIDSLYEALGASTDPEARKQIQTAINEEAVKAAAYAIPNEFDRMVASIGGSGLNAFTTEEMTVYHNSFPPNQVEKWCDIYAHRFSQPVFRLFQSELETVYEEKNRAMDNFVYPLFRAFSRELYKNHPYGQQDVLGETEHLKNPSLIKMYQYFDTYYVANNMALVLSGDINAEEVLPIVKAKFGLLQRKDVPKFPEYPEKDFNGREYMKGHYTPIKAGIAAFRTPRLGHPDEAAVDVINQMLSNEGQTGFIDFLVLDQQLLMGQIMAMPHIDHSAALLIIVPKLIGQSIKDAESKVMAELRRIRLGDFDPDVLETAKAQLGMDALRQLEDNQEKALMVVNAFVEGRDWSRYIDYPQRVAAVTKEQVMAAAQKYYDDNYLFLESKMGFPKKEKLEKPGYKPPLPPADARSRYRSHFEALPEGKPVARFVDFQRDIETVALGQNASLQKVHNPHNDIFSLEIRYGKGSLADKRLPHAARFIDLLGTKELDEKAFKKKVAALGSQISLSAEDNAFVVSLTGWDNQLSATLALWADLLANMHVDASKLKIIAREEKSDRKLVEKDASEIGRALADHVRYGKYSPGTHRLSLKELDALNADSLLKAMRDAMDHACQVRYAGRLPAQEVADALRKHVFQRGYPARPEHLVNKAAEPLDERKVYFLDRKDALQSQLYFLKDAGAMNNDEAWLVDAFNEFFGGSMSGLVFQEIREFRSLAYTATAPVRGSELADGRRRMDGYIGCQADKTPEALRVMHALIDSMPAKPERIDGIRKAVIQSAYTERPGFREIAAYVAYSSRRGYTIDPAAYRLKFYEGLTWDALHRWYTQNIASQSSGHPTVTVVTGDSRQIPMDLLRKYGDVEIVTLEQVFRN